MKKGPSICCSSCFWRPRSPCSPCCPWVCSQALGLGDCRPNHAGGGDGPGTDLFGGHGASALDSFASAAGAPASSAGIASSPGSGGGGGGDDPEGDVDDSKLKLPDEVIDG